MKALTALVALHNNLLSISFGNVNISLPVDKVHSPVPIIGGSFYYMYQHLAENDTELDLK
jgi:hypothetical protein